MKSSNLELRPTVFLDFDGTLVDSQTGVMSCVYKALEAHQIKIPDGLDAEAIMGPPITDSFTRFFPDMSPEKGLEIYATYRELYAEKGWNSCELYPGVPELLNKLVKNHQLVIMSNKSTRFIWDLLEHFNLLPLFATASGIEPDRPNHAKEDRIKELVEESGLSSEKRWMVGDRSNDIQGGIRSDSTTIGVLWGYGSASELTEAGAKILAKDPEDLFLKITS